MGEISVDELKNEITATVKPAISSGNTVSNGREHWLRGIRGGQQVEVNATGQVVRVLKTVDATPGHNIRSVPGPIAAVDGGRIAG
jgi:penicillin-binding protein 2